MTSRMPVCAPTWLNREDPPYYRTRGQTLRRVESTTCMRSSGLRRCLGLEQMGAGPLSLATIPQTYLPSLVCCALGGGSGYGLGSRIRPQLAKDPTPGGTEKQKEVYHVFPCSRHI